MDVDTSPKSGASAMVPVAIGLLGVILGGIALFLALSGSGATEKSLKDLTAKLDDATTKSQQALTAATGVETQTRQLAESYNGFHNQVQAYLTQMADAIKTDHEQIKAHSDILDKASKPSAAKAGAGETTTAVAGQGGTHIIVAGDNFSSLAKKYGVSVSAIEAANPGVDSARLKLGQKISIPSAKAPSAPPTSAPAAAPAPAAAAPAGA